MSDYSTAGGQKWLFDAPHSLPFYRQLIFDKAVKEWVFSTNNPETTGQPHVLKKKYKGIAHWPERKMQDKKKKN